MASYFNITILVLVLSLSTVTVFMLLPDFMQVGLYFLLAATADDVEFRPVDEFSVSVQNAVCNPDDEHTATWIDMIKNGSLLILDIRKSNRNLTRHSNVLSTDP